MATRTKRPRFKINDRVTLASYTPLVPAYGGKPFLGRTTVLRVSSVAGKGTQRDPYFVHVTDDEGHFWQFPPDDIVPAEEHVSHATKKSPARQPTSGWLLQLKDRPYYWSRDGRWVKDVSEAKRFRSEHEAFTLSNQLHGAVVIPIDAVNGSKRHHATKKKSPTQLQREIDEVLASGPVTASIRLAGAPAAMQTREFKHRADAQAWLDQQREIAERRAWGGYKFELHEQKRKAR